MKDGNVITVISGKRHGMTMAGVAEAMGELLSKRIKICTSGYYDILHVGHLSSFIEAKKLGDWLTVIVNNDEQIIKKKGYYFMPLNERVRIIKSLGMVDEVVPSIDKDELVCETLKLVHPDIFAKGGEWNKGNMPRKMVETCKEINCQIIWGLGENPPIHHSSNYIKRLIELYKQGILGGIDFEQR